MRLRRFSLLTLLCVLVYFSAVWAAPDSGVPEVLKPWQSWVLHGQEEKICPSLAGQGQTTVCVWPGLLDLNLNRRSGRFSQPVTVYAPSPIVLPGDATLFPQDVKVSNSPAVVTLGTDGRPRLFLEAGDYVISGQFFWAKRPSSLAISKTTSQVKLVVEGTAVSHPYVDAESRMWMQRPVEKAEVSDSLSIEVNRLIADTRPGSVVTRITFSVSGSKRRETLSGLLLPGTLPVSIRGDLPARMGDGGTLEVDVRPGKWHISLTSVTDGLLTGFSAYEAPFGTEVWSFDRDESLRLVKVEGLRQVDPEMTTVPPAWKNYPAYEVVAGDSFVIREVRRGQGGAESRLKLQREVWLDFSGEGATVRDRVSGYLEKRRFVSLPETAFEPGRIALNGRSRLVADSGDGRFGVEAQKGKMDMEAISRISVGGTVLALPLGWDLGFDEATLLLYLPVGFEALSLLGGQFQFGEVWLESWSLLDFFIILLVSVAAARLWGVLWGALFLPCLALLWHQPASPVLLWPVVLLTHGLFSFVTSRPDASALWRRLSSGAHGLVLLGLFSLSLLFCSQQLKLALYPQLERVGPPDVRVEEVQERALMKSWKGDEMIALDALDENFTSKSLKRSFGRLQMGGVGATQTGPALPSWRWHEVGAELGASKGEQRVVVTLLPPWGARLVKCLRVVLLLLLLWRVAPLPAWKGIVRHGAAAGLFLLLFSSAITTEKAYADAFPSETMLKELQERLLEKPACFPFCLSLARVDVRLPKGGEKEFELTLRAEVQEHMALPLPQGDGSWGVERVEDKSGKPLKGVRFKGSTWVNLASGVHTLKLKGRVSHLPLTFRFPLAPGMVKVSADGGWQISGLTDTFTVDGVLRADRLSVLEKGEKKTPMGKGRLGSWFEVTRSLDLGLEWQVVTQVVRHGGSSAGAPEVLALDLLEGEEIRSELQGMTKQGQRLEIRFPYGVNHRKWKSTLIPGQGLDLIASENGRVAETWELQLDPMWHLDSKGIAPSGAETPRWGQGMVWQPRRSETVGLGFTRFPAVPGQTLTVDRVAFNYAPGRGEEKVSLQAGVRATKGGRLTLKTPLVPFTRQALVSGESVPLPGKGEILTLPINPGQSNVDVSWRRPSELTISPLSLVMPQKMTLPSMDFGEKVSNVDLTLEMPSGRWILWTTGPTQGPAVLMWSLVAFVVLAAFAVSRFPYSPLTLMQWALLGVGLVTRSLPAVLLVGGWFFAMDSRRRQPFQKPWAFNAMQLFLMFWAVAVVGVLFDAIKAGLLGIPDMQVAGNGSSSHLLRWSVDQVEHSLPGAGVWSLPVWSFRLVMLVWSLWLAFQVVSWVRWAAETIQVDGVWRKSSKKKPEGAGVGETPS
ncbi:MAG: hypothetical protein MI742_10735 [Desulfobacterales bacterium]|nr:hypothetical protein [Desulfobacterales bacterium]